MYGFVYPGIFRDLILSLSVFLFMMSLLDLLSQRETWKGFYAYKMNLACPKTFQKELRAFIDRQAYMPVCEAIYRGDRFPIPKKSVVSKMSSQKKRVVYTYPHDENIVLELLTYLLLRKYDSLFSDNLFSFRPQRTAKDAVLRLSKTPGISEMYAYKADVGNYFNSIPVPILKTKLAKSISDDPRLLSFLIDLLEEREVLDNGTPIVEEKGIMAGTPLSAFFANLYLRDLDLFFQDAGTVYARYSDDIILFAQSEAEIEERAAVVRAHLHNCGLTINPDKECFFSPEDGWIFLGFQYRKGILDIAPASVKKLKQKMRRKSRALKRWHERNCLESEKAARAFIRVFIRKLFENAADNELTWSYWFFPVLNTDKSLRELDHYAQDCIRFLLSGKRTKARYNARYETLKTLGYRSLVHEYYLFRENQKS